jgi:hypothetical protein
MSSILTLPDPTAAHDLQVLLSRAALADDSAAVRLLLDGGVLATYVSVFHPRGLLDTGPMILGLRTLDASGQSLDVVVPIRSLQARLEDALTTSGEGGIEIAVPTSVNTIMWAAISPPRGGWERMRPIEPAVFDSAARAGIEAVASAVPEAVGSDLVHRVRSQVWSAPIEGFAHVPAGAAFAAFSLGFLGDEPVEQFGSGPWLRFSTNRGHVLVKQAGWSSRT